MKTFRILAALSLFSAAALCAPHAQAQATIDQTKALAGSVTPGDSAGFPVTLSVPGSYKLMSNLYAPAGLSGIVVAADNVSIDLNGFAIISTNTCAQDTATYDVACTGLNASASGIDASAGRNVSIKNGAVQGFGFGGVRVFSGVVDSVRASHNKVGFQTASNDQSVVMTNCVASLNFIGFEAISATVSNSHVAHNEQGFSGGLLSFVSNSSATFNKLAFSGGVAAHATAAYNNKALGAAKSMGNNINQGSVY